MINNDNEKDLQEGYSWERSANYATYSVILGEYIAQACIEEVPNGSILDLACGDGTITKILAQHYQRVVGVDASSTHLSKAIQRVPTAEFHDSLIEDFSTEEKFDGVLLICLLEHVQDPQPLLRKAASFLKEDGVLLVHVPNADAINRHIAVRMGTLESLTELSPFDLKIAGHRRSYTLETLTEEINSAGLTVESTGGVFYKMLSSPQMNWLLEQGPWEGNEFGWGRVGGDERDWRSEFCRACYELGRQRPSDCNVIYARVRKG